MNHQTILATPADVSKYLSFQGAKKSLLLLFILINGFAVTLFSQLPPVEPSIFYDNTPRIKETPCTYTEPGSTINRWDWQAPKFSISYMSGNGGTITRRVDSPFHMSSNSLAPNTAFLVFGPLDYQVSEGWELLYRNFGTPEEPVGEASFGLYNRFTGLTRIFFWIEPNGEEVYQEGIISVGHTLLAPEDKVTAIFETLNIPANALSEFSGAGSVSQLNRVIINGTWMILEFVAYYDPCVCLHKSNLAFNPILASIENVNFTLEGTGTSTPIYGPGASSGSYLGTALDYANGALGSLQSGYKIYKELGDFLDLANDNDAQLMQTIASALPSWLPIAGAIGKVLGFMVGKGRSSGAPTLIGFNHNFEFTANGNISAQGFYEPALILTPGSFFNVNSPDALRPVYDNPLGIFSVLNTPTVEIADYQYNIYEQNGEFEDIRRESYRFVGGLDYIVNSVAGLSAQPVQILGALVWTNCDWEGGGPNENFYSTPLINLSCLEDYPVLFDFYRSATINEDRQLVETEINNGCYGAPELQVVATLQPASGGAQVLFSARYKTDITTAPYDYGDYPEPYKDMTVEQIFSICNPPPPRPISSSELSTFCQTVYDPPGGRPSNFDNNFKTGGVPHEILDNIIVPGTIAPSPNPFFDFISIDVPDEWEEQRVELSLFDSFGRVVWSYSPKIWIAGQHTFSQGLPSLPSGNYILRVQGESFLQSHKIVKN